MPSIEKIAEKEFKKRPKKEQKRLHALKRIPVPMPGYAMDKKSKPRQKKWDDPDA